MIFAHFIVWKSLIDGLHRDFWNCKAMLGLLPPDIIMNTEEIKAYILSNSSTTMGAKGSRK